MSEQSPPALKTLPGIAVELARARLNAGLSHSELHRLTGISRTALIGYEVGRTNPGEREIRKLCDVLRVTPNQLLYGTEQPFEPDEALKRLGLTPEALSFAHLMIMYNMLAAEDRRAIITLMYSILEARHGRKKMAQAADMMKELDGFLSLAMQKIGISQEGLEKAIAPHAAELEAEAMKRLGRFRGEPRRTRSPRDKRTA
jgi:transcriptional regulator with XRE-family HTH domain